MSVVSKNPAIASPVEAAPKTKKHWDLERYSASAFLMPAVLIVLFTSLFPLILSLYLALSRIKFVKGGVQIKYVGWLNFKKLLLGSQQYHFLGKFGELSPAAWVILAVVALGLAFFLFKYVMSKQRSIAGLIGWCLSAVVFFLLTFLILKTSGVGGRFGTLSVTLMYVFIGLILQYSIGLGLALLCAQRLRGKHFFRITFFIPLMITPVGVAYLFRMLSDPERGPFAPFWEWIGMGNYSWATDPWGARIAIIIGDTWQWTPFMFLILLAALENLPKEQYEAAKVDGCNNWQSFRYITFPGIVSISIALILIRMIEAFKIIDLPNIMTNGGPGIASESLTLHSYLAWRSFDIGGSAAVGYMLMFTVVFFTLSFFNLLKRRMEL